MTTMPPNSVDLFTPTETKVLLTLIQRGSRTTVRALADDADLPVTTTYEALRWLRERGMVDWRENRLATLRARVAPVAARLHTPQRTRVRR